MTVVVSGLWRTWLLLVVYAVGGESSGTLTVDTDIEVIRTRDSFWLHIHH